MGSEWLGNIMVQCVLFMVQCVLSEVTSSEWKDSHETRLNGAFLFKKNYTYLESWRNVIELNTKKNVGQRVEEILMIKL